MKTLTVFEKYSRHWPMIAAGSTLLTLVFWGAYMIVSDVLLEGYLRLGAFCFFALALLSFFKVKDGRIQIDMQLRDDGGLEMNYLVRNKLIAEDAFDLNSFKTIEINEMPNKSLYNDFATADKAVRFKRKDNDSWIYLTEVHGRVVPLEIQNAKKVVDFLKSYINRE